jgi:hypothetical protein
MQQGETIQFTDQGSMSEACAIVRFDGNTVGLAISLKDDGDCEVILKKDDAKRLILALSVALAGATH